MRLLSLEPLERRLVLNGVSFAQPKLLARSDLDALEGFELVDLDGDGDQDIAFLTLDAAIADDGAATRMAEVQWTENLDGGDGFGEAKLLASLPLPDDSSNRDPPNLQGPLALDMDGDSDADLLFHVQSFADGITTGRFYWFENGTAVVRPAMHALEPDVDVQFNGLEGGADFDGDGDRDVLVSLQAPALPAWLPNNGDDTFGEMQILETGFMSPHTIVSAAAADVDADGDIDIVSESGDSGSGVQGKIVWHENDDGTGTFPETHELATFESHLASLVPGDFDGDGYVDFLYRKRWSDEGPHAHLLTNVGGGEEFLDTPFAVEIEPAWVTARDLNGDGKDDMVQQTTAFLSPFGSIEWVESLGDAAFAPTRKLLNTSRFQQLAFVDADEDGREDLIGMRNFRGRRIELFRRERGDVSYGPGQTLVEFISGFGESERPPVLADLDGDGRRDMVLDASTLGTIGWFNYLGEELTFADFAAFETNSGHGPCTLGCLGFGDLATGDVDGDGDLDIVAKIAEAVDPVSGDTVDTLVWYEHLDGTGDFGPRRFVAALGHSPFAEVLLVDIEGDGDLDVVTTLDNPSFGTPSASGITWAENLDGKGRFGELNAIHDMFRITSPYVANIDRDQNVDLVAEVEVERGNGEHDRFVQWYEFNPSTAQFFVRDLLGPFSTADHLDSSLTDPQTVDLDGDGDDDILATYRNVSTDPVTGEHAATDRLVWFENLDGMGGFAGEPHVLLERGDQSVRRWILPEDIDLDGDRDIVVIERSPLYLERFSEDDLTRRISLTENLGGGYFAEETVLGIFDLPHYLTPHYSADHILLSDIDGDGDKDLLSYEVITELTGFLSGVGQIRWHRNDLIFEGQLAGDHNGNGTVGQADLDLVLLHWGQDGSDLPDGWLGAPPDGPIDQEELDLVLLKWGHGTAGMHAAAAASQPVAVTELSGALQGSSDRIPTNATSEPQVTVPLDSAFAEFTELRSAVVVQINCFAVNIAREHAGDDSACDS